MSLGTEREFTKQVRRRTPETLIVKKILPSDAEVVALVVRIAGAWGEGRQVLLFGKGGRTADARRVAAELVGSPNDNCNFRATNARQLDAFKIRWDMTLTLSTGGGPMSFRQWSMPKPAG